MNGGMLNFVFASLLGEKCFLPLHVVPFAPEMCKCKEVSIYTKGRGIGGQEYREKQNVK